MVNQDSLIAAMRSIHDELRTLEAHPLWAERSAQGGFDPSRSPLVAMSQAAGLVALAIDTLRDDRDRAEPAEPAGEPTAAPAGTRAAGGSETAAPEPPRGRFVPDASVRSTGHPSTGRKGGPRGDR